MIAREHLSNRATTLIERIERTLIANFDVLPFDLEAARVYGDLRASL